MEEKPVTEKRFGECRYHMHKQHMLAYLDGLSHTQFWTHSIFINNQANVTYFLTVSLTKCNISNSVWQYTAVTNGFHINSPQKIKKGKVFLKKQLCTTCLIRHVQFYLTF